MDSIFHFLCLQIVLSALEEHLFPHFLPFGCCPLGWRSSWRLRWLPHEKRYGMVHAEKRFSTKEGWISKVVWGKITMFGFFITVLLYVVIIMTKRVMIPASRWWVSNAAAGNSSSKSWQWLEVIILPRSIESKITDHNILLFVEFVWRQ